MTPDARWLRAQGEDAVLLQSTATAFDRSVTGPIGVAVSGGGDSMALLHLLARLADHGGQAIRAVTVDHGLRAAAADEARQVAQACAALNVPHDILNWQRGETKGNLMAQARDGRYALIADWAARRGVARVALGHTADDQAETFVMRLARRAGVDGLAAMARAFDRDSVTFCRPLLLQRRDVLRAFLVRNALTWCEDPTNDDTSFERTRARRVMQALGDLGIDANTLSAVSGHLASARSALIATTAQAAGRFVTQEQGDLILERLEFLELPYEIQRRLLQSALRWISGAVYPERAQAVDDVLTAIGSQKTATLGGCLVTTARQSVRITREWSAVRDKTCAVGEMWDSRWQVTGPAVSGYEVRALSKEGLVLIPAPLRCDVPRATLTATPAIWRGDTLVSAPLAGFSNGWTARLATSRDDFAAFLLSH